MIVGVVVELVEVEVVVEVVELVCWVLLHLVLFSPLPPRLTPSSSLLLFPCSLPASACWTGAGDGSMVGVMTGVRGGRPDPSTLVGPGTTPAALLSVAEGPVAPG